MNKFRRYSMLFLILLIYVSLCYSVYVDKIKDRVLSFNELQTEAYNEIKNGDEIEQTIKLYTRDITKITLYSATFGEKNAGKGNLEFSLIDDEGKTVYSNTIKLSTIKDNAQLDIKLDKPFYRNNNKSLRMVMKFNDMSKNDKLTFYIGNGESEHVDVNGDMKQFALRYDITSNSMDYYSVVCLICAIIIGILIIVMYCYLFIANKNSISIVFLIFAVAMGIVYFAFVPEYGTPDELRHIETAYSLSNKLYGEDKDGNVYMRQNDYRNLYSSDKTNVFHKTFSREYYNNYYYSLLHDDYVDNTMIDTKNAPLDAKAYLYMFSGAGILLGRVMGLNSVITFLLGAVFNYLFFIVGVFYAIRMIPKGKAVLCLIAILPITMQQASSYSYDCFIIVSSFVFISLCFRMLYMDLKWLDICIMVISAIAMSLAKSGAYLPILLLLLVIVISKWKNEKKIDKIGIGILVITLTFFVVNTVLTSTGAVSNLSSNGNLSWIDEKGYSLGYLLGHPNKWFVILWETLINEGANYFYTTFGGGLGWLDINVAWWVIIILFLAIVVVSFSEQENMKLTKWMKIAILSISFITAGVVCGALLLGWTPITSNVILGVQGRYFLPFLPLVFWGIQTSAVRIRKDMYNKAIFTTILMQPFIVYAFISVK